MAPGRVLAGAAVGLLALAGARAAAEAEPYANATWLDPRAPPPGPAWRYDAVFEAADADAVEVGEVSYEAADGTRLRGFAQWVPAMAEGGAGLPAVVVFPDWDGTNEFELLQGARLAFDADVFGVDVPQLGEGAPVPISERASII